jgi:acyl-CoA synthetase (NDP forming)
MATQLSPARLGSLFRPRNIALVGASDKSAFSAMAYRNLVDFGFSDSTYLVNRRGVPVHGQSTVTSCADIGEPVDVAFLMVPQAGTLDALSDAAAAGIANAVVLSSGYGEAGDAGRRAQAELVAHAESLDMALLGPNHLGFANLVDQIPVTPVPGLPRRAGRIGLLSQSGASSGAMVEFAAIADADLSYLVTLGNEAMITAGHVLEFLVEDENTDAIAIFMETVREPQRFAEAARRAAEAGKAIVVLKAGSSQLSARTAAAHTGALVGDDRVISAVFADLGVIRVDTIEDMMITAGAAARLGRLSRPGIGVVSISGGACDIVADRAEEFGAPLPELSAQTKQQLVTMLPGYGTVQNPLDVTGAAMLDPTLFTRTIQTMSQDPSIGVVAVVNVLPWQAGDGPYPQQVFVDAIGAGAEAAATPVSYVNQVSAPITDATKAVMAHGKITHVIGGLRQAVVALSNVGWWSQRLAELAADSELAPVSVVVPEDISRTGAWSEHTARTALAAAEIPVVPATLTHSAAQAVAVAAQLAGPVALKIVSPEILHKSDIGAVRLAVTGADDVEQAYQAVVSAAQRHVPDSKIEGVLVSPMRSGGVELLVGVVRDPSWGLMLAVAVGGIFVEVLDDSVIAPLPVDRGRARRMLDSLRGAAVLRGARGGTAADLNAVAAVIEKVGNLALALGDDLESLEINPLRVDGSTVEALDAVITWSPRHEDDIRRDELQEIG